MPSSSSNFRSAMQVRPLLVLALSLSIPAFYLVLDADRWPHHDAGRWLYALVALLIGIELCLRLRQQRLSAYHRRLAAVDLLILVGAIISIGFMNASWHVFEWALRLLFCVIVFLRLASLLARYVAPHRLLQIGVFALFLLAIGGEGFVLLEPKIHSYADGIWLAFLTVATLGYGDLVPSTAGSRIFSVFIVLLGYAMFSIFTASISAILVGEDERRLRYELHHDLRMLRTEIASLRTELHGGLQGPSERAPGAGERGQEQA